MTILKKRPKERMGVRVVERKESAQHRRFVRSHVCIVNDEWCDKIIQCAHVRRGLPAGEQAGMSEKPHDCFTVPMCSGHHARQHRVGEESFEKMYGVNLLGTALSLAAASPDPAIREKAKEIQKIMEGR